MLLVLFFRAVNSSPQIRDISFWNGPMSCRMFNNFQHDGWMCTVLSVGSSKEDFLQLSHRYWLEGRITLKVTCSWSDADQVELEILANNWNKNRLMAPFCPDSLIIRHHKEAFPLYNGFPTSLRRLIPVRLFLFRQLAVEISEICPKWLERESVC